MSGWYYQCMGETIGPVSSDELRRHAEDGRLLPESLVRSASDERWQVAEGISDLWNAVSIRNAKEKDLSASKLPVQFEHTERQLNIKLVAGICGGIASIPIVFLLGAYTDVYFTCFVIAIAALFGWMIWLVYLLARLEKEQRKRHVLELEMENQRTILAREQRRIKRSGERDKERKIELVTCPACNEQVSNHAEKCIHCGHPFKSALSNVAAEAKMIEMIVAGRPPEGSVGQCPACSSRNTYDLVSEQRRGGGFFGALGARHGLSLSGGGRFRCRSCGHHWEFSR
jgi:hypothetical protein